MVCLKTSPYYSNRAKIQHREIIEREKAKVNPYQSKKS